MHNGGKVNELYLEKAGPLARVANREDLPITDQYFAARLDQGVLGGRELAELRL